MDAIKSAVIEYVQSQPWAIQERWLDIINGVLYARLFASPAVREQQLAQFHAEYGTKAERLEQKKQPRKMSKVAVIPMVGIIGKRMSMMGDISSPQGVSTDNIKRQIESALADPEIDAIVLDVDSPGGTVSGTKELADFIYKNRNSNGGPKPIVAHANELMCSAAYWICAACDRIYASETANVGNIGVYTRHYDFSGANEKEGVKATYFYAGKYKTLGNPDEPMSDEGKEIIQRDIDTLYSMFVDGVAKYRGIDAGKVSQDALALMAKDAQKRGLIDDIMTFDDAVQKAANLKGKVNRKNSTNKEDKAMDVKTLKEEHPEVYATVFAEGRMEVMGELQAVKKIAEDKGHEVVALQAENTQLKADNAKLDKDLTIEKTNTRKKEIDAEADKISLEVLGASKLTDGMQAKVKAMPNVAVSNFTKDGVFDAAGYRTALEAEVKDWESNLGASNSIGLTTVKKTEKVESNDKKIFKKAISDILS